MRLWEVFPPGHAAKLQKKWGKRLLWRWLLRDNRYFNVGGRLGALRLWAKNSGVLRKSSRVFGFSCGVLDESRGLSFRVSWVSAKGGASFEESACVGWSEARVKTETPRSAKRGTALLIQTLGAVAYASAGASVASSAAGASSAAASACAAASASAAA